MRVVRVDVVFVKSYWQSRQLRRTHYKHCRTCMPACPISRPGWTQRTSATRLLSTPPIHPSQIPCEYMHILMTTQLVPCSYQLLEPQSRIAVQRCEEAIWSTQLPSPPCTSNLTPSSTRPSPRTPPAPPTSSTLRISLRARSDSARQSRGVADRPATRNVARPALGRSLCAVEPRADANTGVSWERGVCGGELFEDGRGRHQGCRTVRARVCHDEPGAVDGEVCC